MTQNNQITLRALEPDDVELLYKWENDLSTWKVSNTHVLISKFMLANYIKSSDKDIWDSKELRLVIENVSKPVGTIELFDFDPFHNRAGLGVMVFESENRRKGIASESIQLIEEYSKNELGIYQLYVNIAQSNSASITLFEKLGYQLIGIKKNWLKTKDGWDDELFYQKFL